MMTVAKKSKVIFPVIAAISGAMCVLLGAFAAHALKSKLAPAMLDVMQTGIQYQFYHTLALLMVAILLRQRLSALVSYSGWAFLLGMVCFSGSLYLLVLASVPWVVYITPVGGTLFVLGWILLAVYFIREKGDT